VPCKFSRRILNFSTNRWIKAIGGNAHEPGFLAPESVHWIYLDQIGTTNMMCGPYWRSLIQAWDIGQNDVITFTYDSWSRLFRIKVFSEGNVRKPWLRYPGMFENRFYF
jgi:hypothetical protein